MAVRTTSVTALLLLAAGLPAALSQRTISGTASRIVDGDTLWVGE
jgi:endonuclease YncB( thermonuclease family)